MGALNRIESQPSTQNAAIDFITLVGETFYTMMAVTFKNMIPSRRVCVVYTCNYKNAALDDLLGSTSTSWCDPLAGLRGVGRCSNFLILQLPAGTMYVSKGPR